jgi:hypothetical protein
MSNKGMKLVREKSWVKPNSNFKGYIKKFDTKKKEIKDTYYNKIPFAQEVYAMVKELEDPERMGMRKGSGLNAHVAGTEKLRELNIDPLELLDKHIAEIEALIQKELLSGNTRSKYITDLQTLKFRILEAMLPYRYGKAPITTIEHVDIREPIEIVLIDNVDQSSNEVS